MRVAFGGDCVKTIVAGKLKWFVREKRNRDEAEEGGCLGYER